MVFREFIGLRVLNSTKENIQTAADKKGLSISEFIRKAIVHAARTTLTSDASSRVEVSDE